MLVCPMSTTDCIIHNDKKLTLLISLVTEKSKMESVCYYSGDLVGMPEQTRQAPCHTTRNHTAKIPFLRNINLLHGVPTS